MRLYLSSFRLGTDPAHLVELAGTGARVAVVANAIDDEPPELRRAKVAEEMRALAGLGLRPSEVDLRDYFDGAGRGIAQDLSAFDALWVRGGNVFVLRHALAASAADAALVRLLAADRFVYAGYSAGPCVLGPSLDGLETVDDPDAVRRAYGAAAAAEATSSGLGILDRRVVPHVRSPGHPATAALDRLADRYEREGFAPIRLRDGEALVVRGGVRTLVGHPSSGSESIAAASDPPPPGQRR